MKLRTQQVEELIGDLATLQGVCRMMVYRWGSFVAPDGGLLCERTEDNLRVMKAIEEFQKELDNMVGGNML